MQKESAYNPHDVSYADAIGLLQMIPPTSRRVAERIGRPYTDDVLYDPEGNIRSAPGTSATCSGSSRGRSPLGAGSYNAGPQRDDEVGRSCTATARSTSSSSCAPYTQTREYMKKVLDIYARYVYLYEKAGLSARH